MAYDNRRTYLCYNNSDLIRDGYIKTKIEKEYLPVSTFDTSRLKNPPKGVSYVVTRDSDTQEISAVKEVKKQLPAAKIKIEIDFSKVMKNAVTHPIEPGSLGFSPLANVIATPMLGLMGFGGITSGLSYFTMQILDSRTKINRSITVTQEMIDTGIWECDEGYPLSVFGIVKSVLVPSDIEGEEDKLVVGLEFDEDDPLKDPTVIGQYSAGTWKGTSRKRIAGATDSDGLFGAIGIPEIEFKNVAYPNQPQLFNKLVRDERKLKFRGDNYDATGGKDYPFRLTGVPGVDATDKQIRLNLKDKTTGEPLFKVGDNLYITYCVASARHVRQNYNHRGDIAQGNTIGISGFMGAIKSEVDAFDYQMMTWKVPSLPYGLEMSNIDDLSNFYTDDSDYKLTLSDYVNIRASEEAGNTDQSFDICDTLEGWRLSEAITNGHVKKFWAADYRGILLYDNGKVEIVYPAADIRDQDWFRAYLESLEFTYPSGGKDADGNDIYLTEDLQKKLEDRFDESDAAGFLFDLTEVTNSMLFDREKIPYYRPLANSLKNISKYKSNDDKTGVGIILPDLINVIDLSDKVSKIDLELYDLSYIEFYNANAQPVKRYNCEDSFDIHAYNYWSESYDTSTNTGGVGAWYDRGYIENSVLEWRPAGGSIESYWKLETPYFCGDYTRQSRIYTERVSGPSLDNYSWIFTDTDPFVPHNISSDSHKHFGESIVVFNDDNVHQSLSYNKFMESSFEENLSVVDIDKTRSHVKDEYNHDADMVIGQNRIIGDAPSYSNGIPIVDDVNHICYDGKGKEFWFSEEIYKDASYGLDFEDDIPRATIPADWYIRKLIITFSLTDFDTLSELEKYVSFYFEGSESSISEVRILKGDHGADNVSRMVVDFKYYYSGPLRFLGDFWKKTKILNIISRHTTVNDSRNVDSIDINDYKIKSGQNAVVYDGLGRLMVFYANTDTGNIDVAISYDDGDKWGIHKSLIRLIEGESAGLPFAIKDHNPDYIHLFFTLNDVFLMYKRINTDHFYYSDMFVEPKVPVSYGVDSYDQKIENPPHADWPEKSFWGEYSDDGNFIRRSPCYFIAGDASDPYFEEQMDIRDALNLDWQNNANQEEDIRQYPRFEFSGQTSQMKDSFRGEPYCVYIDDEGVLRLFITSDGKMSVKRSNNYFSWKYDIEGQVIHKDFKNEQLNKGMTEEIQNIQVVRNDYTSGWTSVLYFHAGMLFVRNFQSDLLFPFYDSNGDMNNEDMKEHLELTNSSTSLPIFLVGKIPDNILEARLREIDNDDDYSELFIHFPYNKDMLEKFDERFEVDVDTQVYAYTTKSGLIRLFYKDSFDNLDSIVIDSLKNVTLEVMNKFKEI